MKPIRVLLADDHVLFRAGIRALLEKVTDVEVIGEASTGREALPFIQTRPPDVVLMDSMMPELNVLKTPSPFEGPWRIVSTSQSTSKWDEEYLHEQAHAFIDFNKRGGGEFLFGYVHGFMDCRLAVRDGEPAVEWTWDGNDEMDQVHCRGWAVLKGVELHGMIYFHQGDESEFVAKKVKSSKRANKK